MPFVEARVSNRDEECGESPSPAPALSLRANAAENRDAEDAELRDMGEFADRHMPVVQHAHAGKREQITQNWNDHLGGLAIAEVMRGENGNKNGDENRRQPVDETGSRNAQESLPQARRSCRYAAVASRQPRRVMP